MANSLKGTKPKKKKKKKIKKHDIVRIVRVKTAIFNPCPTEYNKMPHPLLILSQSDYLIQIVHINSHTLWQTVQIQISWLLQKPTDLDLHCLQRQDKGKLEFLSDDMILINANFVTLDTSTQSL